LTAVASAPRGVESAHAPRHVAAGTRLLPAPEYGWLIAAAGALVIATSYRTAQDGGSPTLYYGVFWLGMLLMVAPFAAVLFSEHTSPRARTAAVLSLGLVTFVPKFLRNPYGPLYHDELAHFRGVQDVLGSQTLFERNPVVTIAGDFPGMHIATATLQGLTGLPFWAAATALLLVAHVATIVAVLLLARMLLPDPRGAGVAVILYAANPSYLYFDTQFSYESLAICFFLWTVALTVAAVRTSGEARRTRLVGAVVLTLACVTTHHLTTLFLIALAAIACAAHALFRRPPRRTAGEEAPAQWRPWGVVLGTAVVGLTVWVLTVADNTYRYLSPYAATALDQLAGQASGSESGRRLYSGDVTPVYERVLGMVAPLGMLAAFLVVVWTTRLFRHWALRRTLLTFAAFALVYFASVPFILAPKGAEGARRTWGFTYVGLALCVAGLVAVWLWHRSGRRWTRIVIPLVLFGLLMGNTGAGLNDAYRFPGPYRFGSDTRSLTTEALAVAEEFGDRFPDQRVVSDRFTSLALIAYGDAFSASASTGFPIYDLFFRETDPEPFLVHELEESDYAYLVVDERISDNVPLVGSYFDADEPKPATAGRSAVPQAALDRFETVPWATQVLATSNYSVYRLHLTAVGVASCNQPGCRAGAP
jgi:hypothetical protein